VKQGVGNLLAEFGSDLSGRWLAYFCTISQESNVALAALPSSGRGGIDAVIVVACRSSDWSGGKP